MKFRVARHTKDLDRIEDFYMHIVGLESLGGFKNHSGYDGLFLGIPEADWHLEFTVSDEDSKSIFDDDDMLVFYLNSTEELEAIERKLQTNNLKTEIPKNPYWKKHGIMVSDPDGYRIVFAVKKSH